MTRSCQINKYIFFLFYLSLRLIFFSLSLLLFVAITALSLSEQCCYISDFVFVLFFKINIASLAIQIRGKKYYDSNLNIEGLMDIRKIVFFLSSFQWNISFMAIINNYNNLWHKSHSIWILISFSMVSLVDKYMIYMQINHDWNFHVLKTLLSSSK
jgi:hypothetical protein